MFQPHWYHVFSKKQQGLVSYNNYPSRLYVPTSIMFRSVSQQ
jgi:hypothetical protein